MQDEKKLPLPPFTKETAEQKVRMAENGWNGKNPQKIAMAYSANSQWRNRDVFLRLHSLANELVDKPLLDGNFQGIHAQAISTLAESGNSNPVISKYSGFASHTWAIRVMVYSIAFLWLVFLLTIIFGAIN